MRQRRTDAQRGLVNFPTDSDQYKSTREGGMWVQLVVVDENDEFDVCCTGAYPTIQYDNVLIGDDQHDLEGGDEWDGEQPLDEWTAQYRGTPAEQYHFPWLHDPDYYPQDNSDKTSSIAYETVINLGSTGWSGHDGNQYWRATWTDLTTAGQELYAHIHTLYGPKAKLFLLTWLDT